MTFSYRSQLILVIYLELKKGIEPLSYRYEW